MKKTLSILITTFIILTSSCQNIQTPYKIECVTYNSRPILSHTLTKKSQIYDLETLLYLIETSYAGKDSLYENGFSTQKILKKYNELTQNIDKTDSDTFASMVSLILSDYINDYNFVLLSNSNTYHHGKIINTFFSDYYFVKQNDSYYCVNTNKENIEFTDNPKFLLHYPAYGDNIYRLVLKSNENTFTIDQNISFNSIPTNVTFHKRENSIDFSLYPYTQLETDKTVYIKLDSFEDSKENKRCMDYFLDSTSICLEKDNIIIDLRNNIGGNTKYFNKFLSDLTQNENINCFNTTQYVSPAIMKQVSFYKKRRTYSNTFSKIQQLYSENPNKSFYYVNNIYTEQKKILDKTKIYFIVNSNTSCAAEFAILQASNFFNDHNFFIIGDSTSGLYSYGNIFCYKLPNSNIYVQIPSLKRTINNNYCIEQEPLIPNVYTEDKDLIKTLDYLLDDKKIIEMLHSHFEHLS